MTDLEVILAFVAVVELACVLSLHYMWRQERGVSGYLQSELDDAKSRYLATHSRLVDVAEDRDFHAKQLQYMRRLPKGDLS